MTPQEKAEDLMIKFDRSQINIICDEIIKAVAFDNHRTKQKFEYCEGYPDICFASYWEEVKTELNEL